MRLLHGMMVLMLVSVSTVYADVLWQDDFNRTNMPLNGSAGWTVNVTGLGEARITNNAAFIGRPLTNNPTAGNLCLTRSLASVSNYAPQLYQNADLISWGVQVKKLNFNPTDLNNSSYEYAFVLAASSTDFVHSGVGYFVASGDSGSDTLFLGRYSNGFSGVVTPIALSSFPMSQNASAALRVDYNPRVGTWYLFASTNSAADPLVITNQIAVCTNEQTLAQINMPYAGVYYCFLSNASNSYKDLDFDDFLLASTKLANWLSIPAVDGGGVLEDYWISSTEVSVGEYVQYLNAAESSSQVGISNGVVHLASNGYVLCHATLASSNAYVQYNSGASLGSRFTSASGKQDHPMIYVSWFGAAAYCNWLSELASRSAVYQTQQNWNAVTTNGGFHLPTEAEWYKAAAWSSVDHVFRNYGTGQDVLSAGDANDLNSGDESEASVIRTTQVGSMWKTSPYGLYDASGNVWEWSHDLYDVGQTNAAVAAHALRGGSWGNLPEHVRTDVRIDNSPDAVRNTVGFRVVTIQNPN